ncbi:MAG: glycosyltransferase family 2 protein [Ramlibacter sp.]|nr:glycosyltransferase family 2 protein [Ramlibacter sp.]
MTCPVSVMIFTLDEAIHLPTCLAALAWCDDIIVVDSFSSDSTAEICRAHGVRFLQNKFEGFGTQRNWALDHAAAAHPWILILDADERVSPELADELKQIAIADPTGVGAYRVRRRFHLWGRWLKHSSLYPTWVVRFIRAGRVRYENRGHAETQHVTGSIGDLQHDLIDENLKGIDEWFERQNRYSSRDARFEFDSGGAATSPGSLFSGDALVRRAALKRLASRMPARGLVYFLYSYVLRGGFLDGREGLEFCRMRAMYQSQVAIKVYDMERRKATGQP